MGTENLKTKAVVFAIAGYKNTGKTTLMEKVIKILTEKGYTVAAIKHDGHDFDVDREGTDSFRHHRAGAYGSAVYSESRFYAVKETKTPESRVTEKDLIRLFPEADVILIEGLKESGYPKYICRYPEEIPDAQAVVKEIGLLMGSGGRK